MRIVPLQEVLKLDPGEVVPCVKARIKTIHDRKTGTGQYGAWSVQNIQLTDVSGVTIKAGVWNRPAIPSDWRGKIVVISSNEGKKGLAGVKVKEEEYRGQKNKSLEVADSALFEVAGMPEDAPPSAAATQTPPPAQNAAPAANGAQRQAHENGATEPPQRGPNPEDGIKLARKCAGRHANALSIAFDAAWHVAGQFHQKTGVDLGNDAIKSMAVHICISMGRDGVIDGLPSGRMEKPQSETPANAQN